MKRMMVTLIVMCMLSSCTSANSDSYVDQKKIKEKFETGMNESNYEDIEMDDKAKVFLISNYSVSSSQMIVCEQDNKKSVDLQSGIISSLCDIPGCAHDENVSESCLEYQPINNPICTKDGMYYTNYFEPGKLHYKTAGEDEVVFKNTFYTEKEAEIDPDAKTAFSAFVRDDVMYIIGQTYFYTVDINSMEQTCDPVILSDSPIWNADVFGDDFYVTNENLELIRYNMKDGKTQKISDKVWRIQTCKNGLFYIKNDGGLDSIYRSEPDGSGETKLVSDIVPEMYVTDNSIYYISKDGLYKSDIDGKASTKLDLMLKYENGEEYDTMDYKTVQLISCPSSKYIYLLDYKKSTGEKCYNALFRIEKDTGEYTAISLGIWYQPNGGKEEIISY